MSIDQPITVYPKDKKDLKEGKKHTAAELRKINEEWEKKYGKPGRITEGVSLSDFLASHKKKKEEK